MPNAPSAKEIRELFSDYQSEWKDIQEAAQTDRLYAAGDPWTEAEKRERENRPCVSHDEISQYLNQYLNNLRQNKRGIKVDPAGYGASDQIAKHRQNIIRGIEYRSKAQDAYITAADNAVVGGYGFAEITTDYEERNPDVESQNPNDMAKAFDLDIRIRRIANPDTVLIDPDFKEADASDIKRAFRLDLLTKRDFKRRFPKAKTQSFTGEHMRTAPQWILENYVQVAHLWWVHVTSKTLSYKGRTRQVNHYQVVKYLTNGLEILEEHPWAGSYIPLLACFGKEVFLEEGAGPKRHLISMVRLARDPQKTLAYLVSQEMEEAGLSPKVPWIGYKGQFDSDAEAWESSSKVPHGMLQADVVVDGATGKVLPLPQRIQFTPNFQSYELAKDGARRAIMSAMGISPLPTAAQRANQKSGVALDKISTQEAIGSFHFTDNFDRFLENGGRQINELLRPILDTQRDVYAVKDDGTPYVVHANYAEVQGGQDQANHANLADDEGRYAVTISTGPSYQSQRQAAQDFVDTLVQNLGNIPAAPPVLAQLLSLAIRLKDLGPIGDQISDLLAPPKNGIPPEAQAAIAQLQGQLQLAQQALGELQNEKQAKIVDNEYSLKEKKIDSDTKIAVAEIQTKAQVESERQRALLEIERDFWKQGSEHAHDLAMQHHQQAHEVDMSQRAAALQSSQQESQQAHEKEMAESEPGPGQAQPTA